jgi:hypothetical protein
MYCRAQLLKQYGDDVTVDVLVRTELPGSAATLHVFPLRTYID